MNKLAKGKPFQTLTFLDIIPLEIHTIIEYSELNWAKQKKPDHLKESFYIFEKGIIADVLVKTLFISIQ